MTARRPMGRSGAAGARLGLAALLLLASGCVVLEDHAGVAIPEARVRALVVGSTTRAEVLDRFGPPTGVYGANLLASVLRVGAPIEQPATPGRIDESAFTWQEVDVRATAGFFPILFLWVDARVERRTLTVFFDATDRVRYVAWREDGR